MFDLIGFIERRIEDIQDQQENLSDLLNGNKDLGEWFEHGIDRRFNRLDEAVDRMEHKSLVGIDRAFSTLQIDQGYQLQPGDVIGIRRPYVIHHFGVYIGDDKVIHYHGKDEGAIKPYVEETSLDKFLEGQKKFYAINEDAIEIDFRLSVTVYSQKETIERAKSQIGVGGYDLLFNNCEHFATWCKFGTKFSLQGLNASRRHYITIG
jgi:hypothetical protein